MWLEWNAEPRRGRSHDATMISTDINDFARLAQSTLRSRVGLAKSRPCFLPFVPRSREKEVAKYSRNCREVPMSDTNVTEARRLCGKYGVDRTVTRIWSRPHGECEIRGRNRLASERRLPIPVWLSWSNDQRVVSFRIGEAAIDYPTGGFADIGQKQTKHRNQPICKTPAQESQSWPCVKGEA